MGKREGTCIKWEQVYRISLFSFVLDMERTYDSSITKFENRNRTNHAVFDYFLNTSWHTDHSIWWKKYYHVGSMKFSYEEGTKKERKKSTETSIYVSTQWIT